MGRASVGRRPSLSDHLPELAGRALDGTEVTLPRDLASDRNLVVLAFRQRQQGDVDAWLSWAIDDLGVPARPTAGPASCYEVPMLGRRWLPGRRLIDGGMATSIADPVVLARTVTVYANVGAVLAPLGIDTFDEVHALVVTRDGTVTAHERGPGDPAAQGRVAAALAGP